MKYYLLNVFTKDQINGNQLAAVFPEQELTQEKMQMIAREFNFSETIFFHHEDFKKFRIFTPKSELPFAGHPTVGAAWLLHHLGKVANTFTLEVKQGEVECSIEKLTYITYPGQPKVRNFEGNLEELLRLSNIEFLDTDSEKIRQIHVGPEFTLVPLKNRAALAQATPPLELSDKSIKAYYVFKDDENHYSVRMFAPGISVPEDAATGSAATALGGYLRDIQGMKKGEIIISQGSEMKRECEIHLRWAEKIQVGGAVKLWGEGTLLNL